MLLNGSDWFFHALNHQRMLMHWRFRGAQQWHRLIMDGVALNTTLYPITESNQLILLLEDGWGCKNPTAEKQLGMATANSKQPQTSKHVCWSLEVLHSMIPGEWFWRRFHSLGNAEVLNCWANHLNCRFNIWWGGFINGWVLFNSWSCVVDIVSNSSAAIAGGYFDKHLTRLNRNDIMTVHWYTQQHVTTGMTALQVIVLLDCKYVRVCLPNWGLKELSEIVHPIKEAQFHADKSTNQPTKTISTNQQNLATEKRSNQASKQPTKQPTKRRSNQATR